MATSQPVERVYKEEDVRLFRLRKMMSVEAQKVMHVVYKEGTRGRLANEPLFDFYGRCGKPVQKFYNNLNIKQTEYIDLNPNGDSFDITLLYQCILWGENGVANRNDDKWRDGSHCLESMLTKIKNRRNALFHDNLSYNAAQFLKETEDLRTLLQDTLLAAKERFKIPDKDCIKMIEDLNNNIIRFREESLTHLNLTVYKKESLFLEKSDYVKKQGRLFLVKLYRRWVYVTPASLICKLEFKVTDIYTQMVLEDQSKETSVPYEDLLTHITQSRGDSMILIEGLAGIGKTTLTKKIMDDWGSGHSTLSKLSEYDLLLYTECRNNRISSFRQLICSLIPKLAIIFTDDDYVNVVLDRKVIVIVDGLDEFNKASTKLFKEILEIKKTHGITVIATTRPERVDTYYQLTKPRGINTKHVKLVGIPIEKREDFVIKYFNALRRARQTTQDVEYLLVYLRRTAHRLSDLWSLPYNLTLLTMLWVYKSEIINLIATAPELYWQIHQLLISKLFERLCNCEETGHLKISDVEKKLNNFIYTLSYEALASLTNDDVILSEESLARLRDACGREGLPAEEMTGSFLKRVTMVTPLGTKTEYSFPHKGLQEFLGALYIFRETGTEVERNIMETVLKEFATTLTRYNITKEIEIDILRYAMERLSTSTQKGMVFQVLTDASTEQSSSSTQEGSVPSTVQMRKVQNLLERAHEKTEFDLKKHQNMLITLLGLFHLKEIKVKESVKWEVLNLLIGAGISSREDWLRILNSVRCDEFVATFVCQQHSIFSGTLRIRDSNFFAYMSLLQTLTDPVKEGNKVISDISLKEPTSINKLLDFINMNKFWVKRLKFYPDFRTPESPVMKENILNQVFQRCKVETYLGAMYEGIQLPLGGVKYSSFSIANIRAYNVLCQEVDKKEMKWLNVCISKLIDASHITRSLPCIVDKGGYDSIRLYIPDVRSPREVSPVAKLIASIMPVGRRFLMLYFPRCELKPREIVGLLKELLTLGVRVWQKIILPSNIFIDESEVNRDIDNLAFRLGVRDRVVWGHDDINEW